MKKKKTETKESIKSKFLEMPNHKLEMERNSKKRKKLKLIVKQKCVYLFICLKGEFNQIKSYENHNKKIIFKKNFIKIKQSCANKYCICCIKIIRKI